MHAWVPAQVALNSERDGAFTGGGFYLHAPDCAVPLETGELLTFPGQLLHGGIELKTGAHNLCATQCGRTAVIQDFCCESM